MVKRHMADGTGMNADSQQTSQDRSGEDDAILPGLGIFAGFMIGAVLSEFVVEDWLTVGPAGLWVAQGCTIAVCILIASTIDGLIRPKVWSWRNRIRSTVVNAVVIMAWWGSAAIGYAIAGDKADSVGWLVALLVLIVISWFLRRRRTHKRTSAGSE